MIRSSRRGGLLAVATIGAAGLLALGGCSGGTGDHAKHAKATGPSASPSRGKPVDMVVSVKHLAFTPATVTVHAGATVTWRDDEALAHAVTAGRPAGRDAKTGKATPSHSSGLFNGKLTGIGKTFSVKFTRLGTYTYYCSIHPAMHGLIVVIP
ncbi:MAG: hypothetical protein DLM59_05655 [Pseudonocardiales bacterium]|nr:MAG: hypothetical protein DLM59_05655 [Pseudonocardiales bacterium]